MRLVYRKHGRSARYENGETILVSECGEAVLERGIFRAAPLQCDCGAAALDPMELHAIAAAIGASVDHPVEVERLIASHGRADHECGDARWSEESRRLHLALVHRGTRAILDRGAFDIDEVRRIAALLARIEPEREAPARLRLAPAVTAALIPALIGVAPPNVRLVQTGGGIDGTGKRIVEKAVVEPPWPNSYRPSYRFRPLRTPLNVRLECTVQEIDRDLPEAVALLAPAEGLVVRVLIEDRGSAYPATVRLVRIDAVAEERTWYPYGAGVWGAEAML